MTYLGIQAFSLYLPSYVNVAILQMSSACMWQYLILTLSPGLPASRFWLLTVLQVLKIWRQGRPNKKKISLTLASYSGNSAFAYILSCMNKSWGWGLWVRLINHLLISANTISWGGGLQYKQGFYLHLIQTKCYIWKHTGTTSVHATCSSWFAAKRHFVFWRPYYLTGSHWKQHRERNSWTRLCTLGT